VDAAQSTNNALTIIFVVYAQRKALRAQNSIRYFVGSTLLSTDSNQWYVLAYIFGIYSSVPKTDAILSAIMVLHFVLSTAGHIGLSDPNLVI
jgi:hypothetical protein